METISEMKTEDLEIGGESRQRLRPPILNVATYVVTGFDVVNTDYGKRVDFYIEDKYGQWVLSSWNIVSEKRFKPQEITGKQIKLTPHSDKKVFLTVQM